MDNEEYRIFQDRLLSVNQDPPQYLLFSYPKKELETFVADLYWYKCTLDKDNSIRKVQLKTAHGWKRIPFKTHQENGKHIIEFKKPYGMI
jgi:hypothetical protein